MNKCFRNICANLSAHGCTIHVRHLRVLNDPKRPAEGANLSPKGGLTHITVVVPAEIINDHFPTGRVVEVSGEARCSKDEIFCRNKGINTAFRRTLRNLRSVVGRDTLLKLVEPLPKKPDPETEPSSGYITGGKGEGANRSILALVS